MQNDHNVTMEEIVRIQSYLRENARNQYESVPLPPFTLFFHPSSTVIYFNYAIPDAPVAGDHGAVLAQLRQTFRERQRTPRFEFFEAFAPALPGALLTHGFIEEARQWSMVCTPERLRAPEPPAGVEIIAMNADSPARDVRDYILCQRQGFNPSDLSEPNQNDLVQARLDFLVSGWQGYLARYEGQPAAAAAFARPLNGVTELAGIATREAFRRRGIASLLSWHATCSAFERGVDTIVLTAGSEAAGRVYTRIGYRPFSTMLSYVEGE